MYIIGAFYHHLHHLHWTINTNTRTHTYAYIYLYTIYTHTYKHIPSIGPSSGISIIETEIRALCAIEHWENNILFYSTPRICTRRRRRSLTYHIIIILYYFPACAGRDYPAGGCGYIIFKKEKKIPSHLTVVRFIVYKRDIYMLVFWAYLYIYIYIYTQGFWAWNLCPCLYTSKPATARRIRANFDFC